MSSAPARSTDLSLSEMLHVLDVARTLHRDSEIVEAELNKEQLYASLRERLLASAEAAGDKVTEEEVNAAIEIYFSNLHRYADPPMSLSVAMAHLYVRRWLIGSILAVILLGWFLIWGLFLGSAAPFSSDARALRAEARQVSELAAVWSDLEQRLIAARAMAEEPSTIERLGLLEREATAAKTIGDIDALRQLVDDFRSIETRLREQYEILILGRPGQQTGVERGFEDKQSDFYLVVEARGLNGEVIPRSITSRETGATRTVVQWGELVPEAVYRRIREDKEQDGVVDERLFAVKQRGWLSESVRLVGEDGSPLQRGGQITEW